MEIIDYEFHDKVWKFKKVTFQDTNLIVGDSGTGKTRLLNTIFNLGTYVAQSIIGGESSWSLTIQIHRDIYSWKINTKKLENKSIVDRELLLLNNDTIIERENGKTEFQQHEIVKLQDNILSVSALREEQIIKPLYDGFSTILRRKFFEDTLTSNAAIFALNQKFLNKIGNRKNLEEIYKLDLGLNPRLYILANHFPEIYAKIIDYFQETFNFISQVEIRLSDSDENISIPDKTPIFCIKDSSVENWIRIDELSSGMQKVLLIITDLFALPSGSIYMIDEYENSLGVGAIRFLPSILENENLNIQLFLTSHHPYIIQNIPVDNWYITHRRGSNVEFAYGKELAKRYSISSQEKYIQLLNDPLYSEGVES